MIVLGIDPGTARLGFGVLRKDGPRLTHLVHGCLETPKTMSQPDRLHRLSRELEALLAFHQPDLIGVERLFFAKNAKTAMTVSEARGMILVAAKNHRLEILEHTPMQVKQAVAGYGGADKRQVQEMVCRLLKLKEIPKPDDAADALAIAYCAAVSHQPSYETK